MSTQPSNRTGRLVLPEAPDDDLIRRLLTVLRASPAVEPPRCTTCRWLLVGDACARCRRG